MIESEDLFKSSQQNILYSFIEPITMIPFEARPIDILLAEYKVNELLAKTDEASLYDFFESLGMEMDDSLSHDAKMFGWNGECNCVCAFAAGPWINFSHAPYEFYGKLYYKIDMKPLPCCDYLMCLDVGCEG